MHLKTYLWDESCERKQKYKSISYIFWVHIPCWFLCWWCLNPAAAALNQYTTIHTFSTLLYLCTRYCTMYCCIDLLSSTVFCSRSANAFLCYCVSPSVGSSTPYWSRINSEKTCPLMVFWNLSVWALNGAENWIVPKDCWERRKKCRLGHLLACHREVLYWQIIESALTHHSPSWRWVLWTMVWIRCQLRPISSEKLARNAIGEVALWNFKFSILRLHLNGWKAFGRLLPKLIMYACSLPGLFIRALMRNKKTKSSLKFRPDPSLMFYLEGRGRVWGWKKGA